MLKLTPILLAILYGLVMYRFSVWRTHRDLDAKSAPLAVPQIAELTTRMAQSLNLPQIKVYVYDIEPVNGLASPDGRIFITRGFLEKYKLGHVTAAELASVIAHELGHVALGHTRRRMIDFSGQNAMRTALAMVLGRFVPGIGPWIAGILTSMVAARMSRNDEYEADAYAAALLTRSGIGTAAQKTLFSKLDGLTGAGGQPLAWLMSHPAVPDRIAAIETLEARWTSN